MALNGDRLAFHVEWRDLQTDVVWNYHLFYYPKTAEVEMHDVKNRRLFLKRTKFNELRLENMSVGSYVNILSRQLRIVDYGDGQTKEFLKAMHEKTCIILPSVRVQSLVLIFQYIASEGLQISHVKTVNLTKEEEQELCLIISSTPDVIKRLIIVEVTGEHAIKKMHLFSTSIQETTVTSFSTPCEDVYCPADVQAAGEFLTFSRRLPDATLLPVDGSVLALIKPHAVQSGAIGNIFETVADQFHVHTLRSVFLSEQQASEFYTVYKDALTPREFAAATQTLTSGISLALQVSSKSTPIGDSLEKLRKICGPADPELCRYVAPKTLRSRYGIDTSQNAIHCTDLEEDRDLELNYIFCIQS